MMSATARRPSSKAARVAASGLNWPAISVMNSSSDASWARKAKEDLDVPAQALAVERDAVVPADPVRPLERSPERGELRAQSPVALQKNVDDVHRTSPPERREN
jgi:hypothetical protein